MANYDWALLNDGDIFGEGTLTGGFNADTDVLDFSNLSVEAADISVEGGGPTTIVSFDGKTVTLNVPLYALTTTNVTFFDEASFLIVGDNDTGTGGDDDPNSITGVAGDDQLIGGGGNDTIDGAGGNDLLYGDGGSDSLVGGNGNDRLDGLDGTDTLVGGLDDDYYVVDMVDGLVVEDTVVEDADEGIDTIEVVRDTSDAGPFSYTLGANIENLLLYDGIATPDETLENWGGIGNSLDNTIVGNGGNNVLDGAGGDDTLLGHAGDDSLLGGDGDDFIDAGSGNDTIRGSEGHDTSLGGIGDDRFIAVNTNPEGLRTDAIQSFEGGEGNDTIGIEPGPGQLDFGVTVIAEYRNDPEFNGRGIIVNLDQQQGQGQGQPLIVGDETIAAGTVRDGYGDTDTLYTQNFSFTNIHVDGIVGSMHDDLIVGGAFANSIGGNTRQIFEGLGGDDTIDGNLDFGGAIASYESSTEGVIVNLRETAYDLGGGDTIGAQTARDGFGGTDTLDRLDGARGSDHGDTIIGGTNDEEHIEGAGGDDYIDGGNEFDNVYYTNAGEAVLVHLGAGAGAGESGIAQALDGTDETGTIGVDELVEIEAAHGGDFDDSLVGGGDGAQEDEFEDEEPWQVEVYLGFEEFQGRAGNDTLDGGDGPAGPDNPTDMALYRESPGPVIVNLGDGTVGGVGPDQASDGFGTLDTLIDINGAQGSRFNDTLVGSDASEHFIGGQGNDSLVGGDGDGVDWLSYDFGNFVNVNMNLGQAIEFQFGGFGFTSTDVFSGFENVIGSSGSDTIVGDGGNNVLVGFEGDDIIFGDGTGEQSGNDTLYGGQDDDALFQTRGNDYIDGGEGNDRLDFLNGGISYGTAAGQASVHVDLGEGTSNADRLENDIVNGAGGDVATIVNIDVVFGTAGHDILTGGSQARSNSGTFAENFRGNGGNDTIDGGAVRRGSTDQVDYANSPGAVSVNLATGVATDGWGGIDTLININAVIGSSASDVLTGGNAAFNHFERFEGRAGSDLINGGAGIDEASYRLSNSGVNVNLGTGIAFDGWGFTDSLVSIERVRGSHFNDVLTGSNNLDVVELFIGEEGSDIINGGAGIDFASWRTWELFDPNDEEHQEEGFFGLYVFIENGSGTFDDGDDGTDTLINIEGLDGTHNADTLAGGDGNQWFRGRGGDDSISGGADTDTADYSDDPLGVVVNLGADTATDGWGGVFDLQGTDTLLSIENVLGSTLGDRITGGNEANLLDGSTGNDTLDGSGGNDTLLGGAGNDSLVGGAGNDTLDGGAGNDVIRGDAGTDLFTDKSGADTLYGGADNDTFRVDYAAGTITAYGEGGSDTYLLNPDATGATFKVFDFDLSGADRDFIDVGALLEASAVAGFYTGQDPFAAGFLRFRAVGADRVLDWDKTGGGDNYVEVLTLAGLGANITSTSFKGYVLGSAAADSKAGTGGDDVMLGLGGNDKLNGGAGNDQLFGGDGADIMTGGAGSDVFEVDHVNDKVIETSNAPGGLVLRGAAGAAGVSVIGDTVIAAIDYSLASLQFVENVQLTANASRATGNALANFLVGNAGNDSLVGAANHDTLDGGVGKDTMDGGAGNDIIFVNDALDVVKEAAGAAGGTDTVHSTVTETLDANVEHLVLLGTAGIRGTGNSLSNSIMGNGGNNTLVGGAGNDTLNGGAGNDSMDGGAGNDLYVADSVGDKVTADASGTDTMHSTVTKTLDAPVENLVLTGSLAINGTGNAAANRITGNGNDNALNGGAGAVADTLEGGTGNDTLDGGAGVDSMVGGAGNDVYVVDVATDVVVEAANGGHDTQRILVTDTLANHVENLVLIGSGAINGTGNSLANEITGNGAANRLVGSGGTDFLNGGGGGDTLEGGDANDTLEGGASADSLIGGEGQDVLNWGSADDTLQGGTAYDIVRLTGGGIEIDLTQIADDAITGIEEFDLTGNGDNSLILTADEILALASEFQPGTLYMNGDEGDSVDAGHNWSQQDDVMQNNIDYEVYTLSGATLYVAHAIDLTIFTD